MYAASRSPLARSVMSVGRRNARLSFHAVNVAVDDGVAIIVEYPGLKARGAESQIEELVQDVRKNGFSLVGARIGPHSLGPVIGEEIESCILVHSPGPL